MSPATSRPAPRRALRAAAAAVLGLLASAAALGAGAAPAAAHAVLQSTTPADRAALQAAPAEVELVFNEPVSAPVGGVRAFDGDGNRVDEADLRAEGGTLRLGLRDGLGDGAYVVTYRVISQDGHPITGAFTFTVGDAQAASDDTVAGLLGSEDDRLWDIAGGVARALAYAGTLLAAGVAAFAVTAHDGTGEARTLRRLIGVGAAVGAVGVLAAIPFAAARITGLGLGAITKEGVAGDVLAESVGLSSIIVLAGLVGLAALSLARWPLPKVPALVAAAVACAGFAVAGHTATADPRWTATLAAALHAVAGAVWFGGLVALAVVLVARRDRIADAAGIVGRFSAKAGLVLLAVAAFGLYLGLEEVGSVDALTSTTYGRVLLAKVGVVALVAAGGAWNRFRLVPALERAPKAAGRRLGRVVRAEAAGLAVAVALTAGLVNVTPAADAAAGGLFSGTVEFGDGSVNVVVDPNRPGPNLVHLYFYDTGGRVADLELDELTLQLSLPSAEIGPLERELVRAGAGHYQADGVELLAGTWTVEIVARVNTFDQLTATVEVPVRR